MSSNPLICRTCLIEDNEMISIYDEFSELNEKISDLIQIFGDVVINDSDQFSKVICDECINDLFSAVKFRQKCKASESTLYTILKTNLSNADDNEVNIDIGDDGALEDFVIEEDVESIVNIGEDESVNQNSEFNEDLEYIEDESNQEQIEDENIEYVLLTSEDNDNSDNFDYDEQQLIIYNQSNDSSLTANETETHIAVNSRLPIKFMRSKAMIFNHQCDNCGAKFTQMKNLKKHLMSAHSIVETFICNVCSKIFVSYDEYKLHKRSHNDNSTIAGTSSQNKEITVDKLADNSSSAVAKQDKKKSHICSQCKKAFISNSALLAHYRTHTGERPFVCNTCKKSFTTQGGLELHERRHTGIKPYKCEICSKRFVETSNLKVHLRSAHTHEKPHQCTYCGRGFSRVFLLQIHLRTHTGEKPFNCKVCHKSFAQQGDLSAHSKIHTGERPHRCTICGKGFIKSGGLSLHMKTHSNEARPRSTKSIEIDECILITDND